MAKSTAKHGGALVDAHTPLHAIVGFVAGVLGVDTHLAVGVFIGARIVESSLRDGAKAALLKPEHGQSLGNEMTDLLFEIGGLGAGQAIRQKFTGEQPVHGLGAHYPATYHPNLVRFR